MSLVSKPAMFLKDRKVRRADGPDSQAAAPAQGKGRPPHTCLKHGLNYEGQDEALRALGDDPAHLADLERGGREQWRPSNALQEWIVLRIARLQLRIERASRMQCHLDGNPHAMTVLQMARARQVLRRAIDEFSREIAQHTKWLREVKRQEAAGNGNQQPRGRKKANSNRRSEPNTVERRLYPQKRTQPKFAPASNAGTAATRPKNGGPSGDMPENKGSGDRAEMFNAAPSSVCGPARITRTGQIAN